MKILCVGVFSNPGSTNIQSAKQFKKSGHEVFCFEYRKQVIRQEDKYLENRLLKLKKN